MTNTPTLRELVQRGGELKKLVRSVEKVAWIPLVVVSNESILGVDASGTWKLTTADGLLDPSLVHYTYLFPLMERPLSVINAELSRALREKGIPAGEIALPLREIVVSGLQGSSYWISRALDWIEGGLVDEQVVASLSMIVDDAKRATQHDRQRMRKMLRQWERR